MGRIGARAAGAWAVLGRARLVDFGVAVILSAVGLLGLTRAHDRSWLPLAGVAAVLATSTVAWRGRAPILAVLVAAGATVASQWLTQATNVPAAQVLALLLVLYSAAVRGVSTRHQLELAGLAILAVGTGFGIVAASGSIKGSTVSTDVQPALAALAAGYLVARQRSLSRRTAAAIGQLRAEEELRASAAAAKERNRVARELHDVVTHSVSAMVVQAGAARITAPAEPELAGAALHQIVLAGRTAIDELRRVVTELRSDRHDAAVPALGLAGIHSLVDGWRTAGLPVEVDIQGDPVTLPAVVDVTCYRVVQEALTNVVKHAPGAPTTVDVAVDMGTVDVRVRNGRATEPVTATDPGSSQGLIGMNERVNSCAGRLVYGPQPDGGFEVWACLPLDGETEPAPATLPFLERARAFGPWPGAVLALAILCGDAGASSSRRGPLALNLALCALMALAWLGRRRYPFLFLVAVNAAAFPISNGLTSINKATLVSSYVFAVPVWTVASWSEMNLAVGGLLVAIGFAAAEAVHWHLGAGAIVGDSVVSAALFVAGRIFGAQRRVGANLAEAHARVEVRQHAREELILAAARAGMVSELDGSVVAQIAAMVVGAEAAERVLESGDGDTGPPITQIEVDGREALAQLRKILGLLRAEHDPHHLSPLLGIDQLDQLVSRHAATGRPTRFEVTGQPIPLLGDIDLVAYRVIEAVLAGSDCDAVDLHFDLPGSLRVHFSLAKNSLPVLDSALLVQLASVGGRIESAPSEVTVLLPVEEAALA